MGDTFGDKFKKAFKIGGGSKDTSESESPLAHGAHGTGMKDQPTTASRAAENTPAATTGTTKETLPSTTKAGPGAVTGAGTGATTGAPKAGGHTGGILDSVKQAMGGAPWQDHHDKTLEALKHAKKAHFHAMQAQTSLKAAQEAQKKAEAAQRHRQELEAELERHRTGQSDLAGHKKNWDDANSALALHKKNHDHYFGLARDAEAAAAAKEAEAARLRPNDEEHTKALQPLEAEAARLTKTRGDAEARREALLRELQELEANLKPMRENEAVALKKLQDHRHHGETSRQAHGAAAAEAAELRRRADLAHKDLEPHAAKLKEHNALVAGHESAYNKAREQGQMTEGRLPELKQQAAQAEKEAEQAAQQARHHSDAFEKGKKEAEAEDAKKAELWAQARKAGHLEEDGADKQDLHKFADRVHTVLKNPIDTSLLGRNPLAKEETKGMSGASTGTPATPERGDMATTKPTTGATGAAPTAGGLSRGGREE